MSTESENLPLIESWDSYWQGALTSDAYTGGESTHPLVLGFWDDYFRNVDGREDNPKIIDIASGSGAVVGCASSVFSGSLPEFTCLDASDSAINMLEERFPGVHGVVADAANIPLDSANYDIATSQFGVEYAGLDALDEMVRLIAPDGELVLMLHYRDGIIFQECTASLEAVKEMEAAEFGPKCINMFEAGFAAMQSGDLEHYQAAVKAFAPAIKAMEAIMMKHGRDVAAGTILKVYRDVRTIHSRMRHYDPLEIKEWLLNFQQEMVAYGGRMASMRGAAIDASQFEQVRDKLLEEGFEILRGESLAQSEQDLPLAWTLIAKKK
ncbi:MAG: class I SAM-dependent methyltransferase [Gammaproteobacteria bacterium]|nr:class I SAM-dependent methyltransferase [Gammaproteobacteria bacterium]